MVNDFVAQRRRRWERLQHLMERSTRARQRPLSPADVEELGRLYRQATSDLAIARRDYPRDRVVVYLEQLVARAHPIVYRGPGHEMRDIAAFFATVFPRLFRRRSKYTLAAFLMFAFPAVAAYVAALTLPEAPSLLIQNADLVEQVRQGHTWFDIPPHMRPYASSFIMTNNLQVAFLTFAGGVLLGLGALWVLVNNGIMLGAVAGLCHLYGLAPDLWSFVLPHGVIELTVIFVAGGAGLSMGHALLAPGLRSRRQALVLASRDAVKLIVGCIPLLVVAGTIEGFISPSGLPAGAKITFGIATGLLLYGFLLTAGRGEDHQARQVEPTTSSAP